MREILTAVWVTLCLVSGLVLRYAPMASLITPEKKRILMRVYGAAMVVHVVGLAVWFKYMGISVAAAKYGGILFAIVTAAVNLLVIPNHHREQMFIFGVVIVCNYLLLAVPSYCAFLLQQHGVETGPFIMLLIYSVMLGISFLPIRKLLCSTVEPFLQEESSLYWSAIWMIPMGIFLTMVVNFPGNYAVESIGEIIGGVVCVGVMISLCWRITLDHKRLQERQLMAKQIEDQKLYYAKLQAKVEEARKTGHDFKHVANVMEKHLRDNDMEGLRSYCTELIGHLNRSANLGQVGDSMADSILSRYVNMAAEDGIQMMVQGRIQGEWITAMDICVILGNLLDNAIEGCRTVPHERKMAVTLWETEDELRILVQNTYDGVVNREGEAFLSRKRKNMAGVGIESVRSLCEKYGGEMEVYAGGYLFSVSLLLRRQS